MSVYTRLAFFFGFGGGQPIPPPVGGFTFKEVRTERDFAIAARRREFIATSSGRIFVVPKQGAGA